MSKYPRSFHLPWSPGATNDDKIAKDVDALVGVEIIISEKMDGSNSCLQPEGVFARSHGQAPTHKSFDLLKQRYYALKHQLHPQEQIFLENCFAVHSITYEEMSDFCFVFGIREDNTWISFDAVVQRCQELGLTPVPILWRGTVKSASELEKITTNLAKQPSVFGGPREGMVVRVADSFTDDQFATHLAKLVRKNHVQTDDHWMNQPIVKQNFRK
jgi:hypothetical protein